MGRISIASAMAAIYIFMSVAVAYSGSCIVKDYSCSSHVVSNIHDVIITLKDGKVIHAKSMIYWDEYYEDDFYNPQFLYEGTISSISLSDIDMITQLDGKVTIRRTDGKTFQVDLVDRIPSYPFELAGCSRDIGFIALNELSGKESIYRVPFSCIKSIEW